MDSGYFEEAIEEAKAAGFLGKNILGTGFDLKSTYREVVEHTSVVKKLHCLNLLKEKEEIQD
jgi:hypothetical protein